MCDVLKHIDAIEVIGEADNGRAALEIISRQLPQLAIVDTGLPGVSGIELLRQPGIEGCRVLLMADREHCHLGQIAIEAGAVGFLPKTATAEETADACRAAARGNLYIARSVGDGARSVRDGNGQAPLDRILTRRERQVLQLLAEGVSTKQMALQLGVSARTIETHRYQIMSKLNERSLPGLTKLAIRHGLTTL